MHQKIYTKIAIPNKKTKQVYRKALQKRNGKSHPKKQQLRARFARPYTPRTKQYIPIHK